MTRKSTKRFQLPDYRGFKLSVTTGGTFHAEHPTNETLKTSSNTLRSAKQYVLNHTVEGPKGAEVGTKVVVQNRYHSGPYMAGKLTGEFRRDKSGFGGRKVLQAQVKMNKKDKQGKVKTSWISISNVLIGDAKMAASMNRLRKQQHDIGTEIRKTEKKLKRLTSVDDVHLY